MAAGRLIKNKKNHDNSNTVGPILAEYSYKKVIKTTAHCP